MEAIFQFVDEVVEAQRDTYCAIADDIWDHPETRFEEFWSAQRLADAPRRKVFSSPAMPAGSRMPLSPASVRANRSLPCSANLTPGGTQPAGPQRGTDALDTGANGHGCGHNLLGTAAFAAAVAAKGWLQQHGDSGTLRFYGCPGEEGGSGKTFMVREGLFDDVDAALTGIRKHGRDVQHPHPRQHSGGMAIYRHRGPPLIRRTGRSALDAVTLMTTGSNFLNEHIIEKARVHYAITDTGGVSPNVVQAQAEVLYLIRAPEMADAEQIFARIEKIARGRADDRDPCQLPL